MSQKDSSVPNISAIPTISDLYKASRLQSTSPDDGFPLPAPSSSLNSKISLVQGSITTLAVTSIVNAANKSLLGGGGVDGAIHSAAGPSLVAECRGLNGCRTGSAKITSAYDLPSNYVIHAVGPIYQRAKRERDDLPAELLTGCYRTSLQLGAQKGGSIAFSCISTGVYGYPSGEAAEVATMEVRQFLLEQERKDGKEAGAGLERVVFCCYEDKDVKAYQKWIPKIFPPSPSELPSTSSATTAPAPTTDDPAAEEWEQVEKPDDPPSSGAPTSELLDEGIEIDAGDADMSGKGHVGVKKAGAKHGLLKDW